MQENINKDAFSKPAFIQSYIEETQNADSLLQKELILIYSEQKLLEQRIAIMKSFVNDLPSSDPQYSMVLATIKMDQVELDELSIRKESLLQKMNSKSL